MTIKEHRLVHLLHYKFTGVIGNLIAYNLMKYGREALIRNHKEISRAGGIAHHAQMRQQDPVRYHERQQKADRIAGARSRDLCLGFHSLSEEESKQARDKSRATTVQQKIGMFSDEYKMMHRLTLQKKVSTPAGVFESMQKAAEFYDVCCSTITYRVKSNSEIWKEWNYIGDNNE